MSNPAAPLPADIARQIVESGVLAPSGDNLQPWRVKWHGDTLCLSIDPNRDLSLYNFRYRASLIALGAMIENMAIAGREYRLATTVDLSMNTGSLRSAALRFQAADIQPDPLFPSIAKRCTNRKPYQDRPLQQETLDTICQAIPADGRSLLQFVSGATERRIIARAASLNDRLLFEIRPLHDRFFESIRWTADEAERSRDGLFVKTLELGSTGPGFKTMRSWKMVQLTNVFGGSRLAPLHSYRAFMRSPAFGFLQIRDDAEESFLEGGRRLQRVWLTATALGLAFQPMAGMLYLLQYLGSDPDNIVTRGQRVLLERARDLFKQVLPLEDGKAPIMIFRMGYGSVPSATSLRRSLPSL